MTTQENLAMVSDSMQTADQYIMAQDVTIDTTQTSDVGTFDIVFSEQWLQIGKIIAGIALFVWIIYAAWNFLNPKNQGKGLQRVGGIWPMVLAAIFAMMFWDLNNTVDAANALLAIGGTVWGGLSGALGIG